MTQKKKTLISYSSLMAFDRCPYLYYLRKVIRNDKTGQRGLELKPQHLGLPLRMGKYLAELMEGKKKSEVFFLPDESDKKQMVEAVVRVIQELKLVDDDVEHEVELEQRQGEGKLDIVAKDRTWFGEVKFTAKPDRYLNDFLCHAQLEYYFLLMPSLQFCYMMPIRVPQLRMKRDEMEEKYVQRVLADIRRRPAHYFPLYDEDREHVRWGRKFYRQEFDLEELERKIAWTVDEIKRCKKQKYWAQRKTNCLFPYPCDFMSICETGGISDVLYRWREKKK